MKFAVWLVLLLALAPAQRAGAQQPPTAVGSTLHPGDVIRVEVWREEDLSGEFIVDETGTVTLPLVGEYDVTGHSIPDVKRLILAAYRTELRNPSIVITPLRRVYVLGEVNKPGLYTVDVTTTLAGAIAMAEGATGAGDLRRVRIVRNGQVVQRSIPTESALASVDILSGDQIFVDQRGWFARNSTFVVSMLLSVSSIAITLITN